MSGDWLHSKQNAKKIKSHDQKTDNKKADSKCAECNQCEFCQNTPIQIFYIIPLNNNHSLMKDIERINVLIDNC